VKDELKSGIPECDDIVYQFENGDLNFIQLIGRLWNKGYDYGMKYTFQN